MSYSDVGEGRAVVFIHAFPMNSRMWEAQSALAGQLRLIRFDLPGFGDAPPLAGSPSMTAYAEAVRAVLDRAGLERAALCGLSMGGYVLFELWRRCPERVSALVLCDTRAEADTAEGRRARLEGIELLRAGRRAELIGGYLPKLLGPAALAQPRCRDLVQGMADQASDQGIIAALQAMHDRPDSTPTLGTIDVPTLVMVGMRDVLTPPEAARSLHRSIRGSRLAEIPEAGHLSALENPAAFNAALLEFLG